MQPALYIISTPIGNLKDITYRAVETLKEVDVIACEDTRVSHKLLSHYGISKKLMVYNDHSKDIERQKIIDLINSGKSIGLITDAGTPLISDPGFRLVAECYKNNIRVFPIPGASSAIAALTVSGLPSDSFYFAGFLPQKQKARQDKLRELKKINTTLVFFESPNRAGDFFADALEVFSNKPASLVREITKLYEEVKFSDLKTLAEQYKDKEVKGEIVILIDNNQIVEPKLSEEELTKKLKELKNKFKVKEAAQIAAETLGLSKNDAYERLIAL
ncbi:MAG TPA: 16S rRNA (cytidine(1402)-2'-O)-methyltransferase [Alphaproteobacteria bacterium]|nr:16S rRNA (cytidine(1402)-2'-O)-methyltransferase [Alphaproteobacteria bacterium]